jgi:hypothetical protein
MMDSLLAICASQSNTNMMKRPRFNGANPKLENDYNDKFFA